MRERLSHRIYFDFFLDPTPSFLSHFFSYGAQKQDADAIWVLDKATECEIKVNLCFDDPTLGSTGTGARPEACP